ncbi:MAG: hypothetical protein Q8L75_14600 [Acidobacteriota bacterium]|nr:hypothetical protein [Acidobacteriota bacterium]
MNSLPLHPAIVHFPLGVAMLMPFIAAGFAWALWTRRAGRAAWIAVVVLQAALLGSSLVAINTGANDEERVERVVQASAIEAHEEAAEQFAWASGVTLLLAAVVLVFRRRELAGPLTAAVVIATIAVAGLGLRVGHAGGQLVYVHGAAAAYAATGPAATGGTPSEARRDQDKNEDHR